LEDAGFTFKSSVRKGSYVLYVKDSGVIEDVITYMGASRFTLELMDIKIIKDLRNNINRKTNCETANIEKTITASAAQIRDIKYLKKTLGLALLPEELKEIALLRLKYPESSLSELGQMLKPPLSRSGVSHRLRRLSAMAKEQKQLIKK
jgi:DNA-binding protein WhiA